MNFDFVVEAFLKYSAGASTRFSSFFLTTATATTLLAPTASHFEGVSGTIACDPHGQCAKFRFAAYEYTNADPKTYDVGKNPKKIYP